MRSLILFTILLVGCGSATMTATTDRLWVLQSYDERTGYVFVKQGVSYHADCFATGTPMIGNKPNRSPEAMPPFQANGEQAWCADVLTYLHKNIPLRQVGGSLLYFDVPNGNGQRFVFSVTRAGGD